MNNLTHHSAQENQTSAISGVANSSSTSQSSNSINMSNKPLTEYQYPLLQQMNYSTISSSNLSGSNGTINSSYYPSTLSFGEQQLNPSPRQQQHQQHSQYPSQYQGYPSAPSSSSSINNYYNNNYQLMYPSLDVSTAPTALNSPSISSSTVPSSFKTSVSSDPGLGTSASSQSVNNLSYIQTNDALGMNNMGVNLNLGMNNLGSYSFGLPIPNIGSGLDLNNLTTPLISQSADMNMLNPHISTPHMSDSSSSTELSLKKKRLNGSTTKPKGDITFPCETCGKVFFRPYNLRSHMKSHTTEKPFACKYCGKAFTRSHDRRRHERLHEEEKKFTCGGVLRDGVTRWGCNRKFGRADALGRHFRTESGWLCIKPSIMEAKELEKKNQRNGSTTTDYINNQLNQQASLNSSNSIEFSGNEQSIVDDIAKQTANSLTTSEINMLLNKSNEN